ncbi:MAG: NUDIX hydrolase [Rhodobiaceae bacterium]|nr:NUDIX hydrolase [Rhodobiaceae bacterium]
MAKSESKKREKQVAALPVHVSEEGEVTVLVITSRDTGRWIIPKGWRMSGKKDCEAAAREAYEEAGVTGTIDKTPIGTYDYDKWISEKKSIPCRVCVYVLHVEKKHKNWPENDERRRRWLSPEKAAKRVLEPELKGLLLGLGNRKAA